MCSCPRERAPRRDESRRGRRAWAWHPNRVNINPAARYSRYTSTARCSASGATRGVPAACQDRGGTSGPTDCALFTVRDQDPGFAAHHR